MGSKVTAIEEAQNLSTLALDDLLRKLLTHEIHLKEDEEEKETQPKQGVAFKTISEEHHSLKDESSEEDEDSMAMIARGPKKIFKSKKVRSQEVLQKGIFLEEE